MRGHSSKNRAAGLLRRRRPNEPRQYRAADLRVEFELGRLHQLASGFNG
jgi:hypothetical protein